MIEEIVKDVVTEAAKEGVSNMLKKEDNRADEVQIKEYEQLHSAKNEAKGMLNSIPSRLTRELFSSLDTWLYGREKNREAVRRAIDEKLESVPIEKRVEPEAYVAVPALLQIDYCYDSEELRNLYANLLVSSMNSDTKSNVHPAFTSIIQQLSPDEAKLLQTLHDTSNIPIIDLQIELNTGGYNIIVSNFTNIGDEVCECADKISTYIENLSRLKLIEIDSTAYIDNPQLYEQLETHPLISKYTTKTVSNGNWEFQPKLARITIFGKQFIEICVTPPEINKKASENT